MWNVQYIGGNQLLTHASNGFHYVFPADDMSVGLHLLLQGSHEPWLDPVFRRLLRKNDKVIIVGSNIGYHDVLASKLVGPEGNVKSFEPNPILGPLLQRNLVMNGCEGFQVFPKAVGDIPGVAQLYVVEHDYGGGSMNLISANGTKPYSTIGVPVVTLDQVIVDGPFRLLKIDAEGSEAKVLRGGMGLIERGNIENIILEHNPDYYTEEFDVQITALRNLGFRCWVLAETCQWPEYIGKIQSLDPCDLLFSKESFK